MKERKGAEGEGEPATIQLLPPTSTPPIRLPSRRGKQRNTKTLRRTRTLAARRRAGVIRSPSPSRALSSVDSGELQRGTHRDHQDGTEHQRSQIEDFTPPDSARTLHPRPNQSIPTPRISTINVNSLSATWPRTRTRWWPLSPARVIQPLKGQPGAVTSTTASKVSPQSLTLYAYRRPSFHAARAGRSAPNFHAGNFFT